ncbi:hypothetical protein M2650_08185 [Luteimonas sp. SX5]|uniref:Uncharacterized protein n=1 Tax=Luteimonas galliterrae TaxID=2940486 RepID=A0ABT0MIA6_9GAMM|nr:hypothetical protein [Luteimonas galliterrae]MCL1634607.1 hypothetical protein [Luteimonas galliterrae]
MSWDAFQRDALDALGHTLYRLGGAESPPPPDPATMTALQRAVLRAAGHRDPGDAALQPMLAAAQRLRADPAGKRSLWPRLRALRREAGG